MVWPCRASFVETLCCFVLDLTVVMSLGGMVSLWVRQSLSPLTSNYSSVLLVIIQHRFTCLTSSSVRPSVYSLRFLSVFHAFFV